MIPDQPQHPDSSHDAPEPERLGELLADRALDMLSAEDAAELEQLLQQSGEQDNDAFDRIAAALQIGALGGVLEPLPDALKQKIRASAETVSLARGSADHLTERPLTSPRPRSIARLAIFLGPIAAAAVVLIAIGIWPKQAQRPSLSALREQLIATAPDAVTLPWTRTADPTGTLAAGDLVWSESRQTGYMRFSGLAPNNPGQSQYQVWIIDADRDERYPVDGGVFDIPPKLGPIIVPITAKLHVGHPKLFAVTIEQPGGVVVSDRKHLPLVAKPSN